MIDTQQTTEQFGPVRESERIAVVDIARGFALLGILLVNVQFFIAPSTIPAMRDPWFQTTAGQIIETLIRWLCEQKFYTLFSFLFGVGFALQSRSAARRGANFASIYRRRLWTLLLIGLLHVSLVWYGDILTAYAAVGFALLLMRNASDRFVLLTAGAAYGFAYFVFIGLIALGTLALLFESPDGDIARSLSAVSRQASVFGAMSAETYRTGTFMELVDQRLADLLQIAFVYFLMAPQVLAMFLLGLVAGRHGWLWNWNRYGRYWKRVLWIALPLGLVLNGLYAYLSHAAPGEQLGPAMLGKMILMATGVLPLSAGYLAILVALAQRERWQRLLHPLAQVGRLALSNYLLQSLVCTTLAYSYGFALFGKVGLEAAIPFAIALYVLQVIWSVWWLRQFRFGPFEWLWRSMTYGRFARFRREPAAGRSVVSDPNA